MSFMMLPMIYDNDYCYDHDDRYDHDYCEDQAYRYDHDDLYDRDYRPTFGV